MATLIDPPNGFAPKKELLEFLAEMQPFQNEPEVREAIEKVKGYLNERARRPLLDQKIEAHWASKDHGR